MYYVFVFVFVYALRSKKTQLYILSFDEQSNEVQLISNKIKIYIHGVVFRYLQLHEVPGV